MTERTRFTAYITKYALTAGIEEVEVEDYSRISPFYHVNDLHRTRWEAVERAEAMRKAKIASLNRSLAKMEGLKFT